MNDPSPAQQPSNIPATSTPQVNSSPPNLPNPPSTTNLTEKIPILEEIKSRFLQSKSQKILFGLIGAQVVLGILALTANYFLASRFERVVITSSSDITFEAVKEDSMGVDTDSEYILKSKNPLETGKVRSAFSVSPEADYKIKATNNNEFNISFDEPLEPDTVYVFRLGAEQVVANQENKTINDLSWAFQTKNDFKVIGTLPRDKATYVPKDTGIEFIFSHDSVSSSSINQFVEISPKLKGRFEKHKRTIVFIPETLEPETYYRITLKKGLPLDNSSETLAEDYVFGFETKSDKVSSSRIFRVGFSREMSEFSPSEPPAFNLYLSNSNDLPTLDVGVYKFSSKDQFVSSLSQRNQVPTWARFSREKHRQDTSKLQSVSSFQAPVQKLEYSGYFVFPESLPEGYYLVEISSEEGKKQQTWMQVSRLAAYLTTSETKTLVWVNNVASQSPIEKATISLSGNESSLGKSDKQGLVLFDTPEEVLEPDQPTFFDISSPSGQSLIISSIPSPNFYGSLWGGYEGRNSPADNYWTYLYLDRPIYQPNDEVNYWGTLKHRDKPNSQQSYTLSVTTNDFTNYFQKPTEIYTIPVSPSSIGTLTGTIPINNLKPGYYHINIKDGDDSIVRSSFSVSRYIKPAYKLDLEPSKQAVFAGEQVQISGKATFFEGTGVANVKLKYSGAKSGNIVTDQTGSFSFSDTHEYNQGDSSYNQYPKSDYFRITPELPEEAEITGAVNVRIFGSKLDLKHKTDLSESTGKVTYDLNNITLDRINNNTATDPSDYLAGPAQNRNISGKLYEQSWEKEEVGEYYDFISKKVIKRYNYKSIKNFLSDISLTTNDQGQANIEFQVDQNKYYLLETSSTDDAGRQTKNTAFVYGRYSQNRNSRNYFSLSADKENNEPYGVGENVNLTMKPSNEDTDLGNNPKYLFRLAQRGIKQYLVQDNAQVQFNFDKDFVPNITAKAVLFNGKTYIESESRALSFNREDKKLSIQVKADKDSYQPKDKVKFNITVKDQDNKGQKSEVNLSLVDEAIFQIQDQAVDTLKSLYSSVASGVIQTYSSHQYPLEANMAEGGGGCFLAGTKILLPGGKTKSIEEISKDELILTRKSEISSELVPAKVTKTLTHTVGEYLLINNFLRVTPEHIVFSNGKWIAAGDLYVGDHMLNSENKWIQINSIERNTGSFEVYNLHIEDQQTYFADNLYVHNQKGERIDFADNAYFGTVQTNNNGQASVSFELPDNLTSWRVTYQGVSQDLHAGNGSQPLRVKLPFFVDMIHNNEYLSQDKPTIKVRAFGESLSTGQDVEFKIESESLGSSSPIIIKAKSFEATTVNLPALTTGKHEISVTGKSGSHKDKLTKTITVVDSRFAKADASFQELSSETKLTGSNQGPTTLIFSDHNRGRFYSQLIQLNYTYGDRADQRLARKISSTLLSNYFDETIESQDISFDMFQTPKGGISLLPYSDDDLALSAKLAALDPSSFDKHSLSSYFYQIVDSKTESEERVSAALYGLASLGKPVLTPINYLLNQVDLSPVAQLYLGLAQVQLGNKQPALRTLNQVLEKYGEELLPNIRIRTGTDQGDILFTTALASNLAIMVDSDRANDLFQYLVDNSTKDILINTEKLFFIAHSLPKLPNQAVEFTYHLDGKTQKQKLEKGQTHKLILSPEQLQSISFSQISGNVGVSNFFQSPMELSSIKADSSISLSRTYSSDGANKTDFSETDLVQVILAPQIGAQSLDGCYQVTDLLPSGLRAINRPSYYGVRDSNIWHPYEVDGQKISFCYYKNSNKPIKYFARVVSSGEYKSESALLQSLQSTQSLNITPSQQVTIR